MAENTNIQWCDSTFNCWLGCTKVSDGCLMCYAEGWAKRSGLVSWGPGAPRRRTSAANWRQPLQWNAQRFVQCAQCGHRCELRSFHDGPTGVEFTLCPCCGCHDYQDVRRRVFCASLADVFDNEVPPEWRLDLFALIANTPNLDWLLLTKRIGNVSKMVNMSPCFWQNGLRNVWLGATIVNQEEADRDIPKLLATPARVRFLSCEPLLGPVDLASPYTTAIFNKAAQEDRLGLPSAQQDPVTGFYDAVGEDLLPGLHWVIVGGESGPKARPMHPDWARSLRDQCKDAGVPFMFKQWGEWGDPDSIEATGKAHQGWWEDSREDGGMPRHEWPGPTLNGVELKSQRPEVFRVGKKTAGRLLDGVTHDGFPEVNHA